VVRTKFNALWLKTFFAPAAAVGALVQIYYTANFFFRSCAVLYKNIGVGNFDGYEKLEVAMR
jgi:hypothetical protein